MIAIIYNDICSVFVSHASKRRCLEKGTYLFHQGDAVKSVFVVVDGCIELTRFQKGGAPLVLQRARPNMFLAEASVYSDTYHCDALVVETSAVSEMKRAAFLSLLTGTPKVSELWATHLAFEVQSARYRSEILARKTVSERLSAWLAWKGGKMPPKGTWKSVADQIGVSPEALYRELANRNNR